MSAGVVVAVIIFVRYLLSTQLEDSFGMRNVLSERRAPPFPLEYGQKPPSPRPKSISYPGPGRFAQTHTHINAYLGPLVLCKRITHILSVKRRVCHERGTILCTGRGWKRRKKKYRGWTRCDPKVCVRICVSVFIFIYFMCVCVYSLSISSPLFCQVPFVCFYVYSHCCERCEIQASCFYLLLFFFLHFLFFLRLLEYGARHQTTPLYYYYFYYPRSTDRG